ncbi:glycosyltransferase [Rufibacter psychrotolerans]|uniref:glycosyltransferase n=1 Tax=Rufibacter psychrotolerans TaxID=2812556 RepID=UPI001F08575C|nr:glycosyltransferase [Rufibacter sp. SYSU D00308]
MLQQASIQTEKTAQEHQLTMPLVSVVIPCYNHAKYLPEAFQSVWQQDHPAVEIIVVDDGSADNTRQVVESTPGVKYVYQVNQGLSAARNTGIKHAKGAFLVFLDADDWLLPGAISTNLEYLQQDPKLAFVSGAHIKVFEKEGLRKDEVWEVPSHHYRQLLQGNYIGMHATVMYRRWVFDEFLYDNSLRSCEDYDLYLKITRRYPVAHHTSKVAAYRLHDTNMSGNIPNMLASVLQVLERQHNQLATPVERAAFAKGKSIWKEYYCRLLYHKAARENSFSSAEVLTFIKHQPLLFIKFSLRKAAMIKTFIKKATPAFGLRLLHKAGLYKSHLPAVGSIVFGDFGRTTPFSREFGYDRGGPVDRYYIENFLQKEASCIKGRVLEIGDNEYTLQYGGSRVTRSDVLHVHEGNPKATLIGDISAAPHIPDNSFDCIVLTQTLHLIYDFKGALATCHRILKPGGALLLTVPYVTSIDKDEWGSTWYWSFTDKALRRMMAESFPNGKVEVGSFGNVLAASAFLYGMGRSEISRKVLDQYDPQFQVINTVKAIKA